jgi:histone H3/H4
MSTVPSSSNDLASSTRMSDSKRIQKILDELGGKTPDNKSRVFAVVDEKAKVMLMEYAIELTNSLIETSSALAKHRNSNTIDVDDVNLILGDHIRTLTLCRFKTVLNVLSKEVRS